MKNSNTLIKHFYIPHKLAFWSIQGKKSNQHILKVVYEGIFVYLKKLYFQSKK
jgi:hypothetical protein